MNDCQLDRLRRLKIMFPRGLRPYVKGLLARVGVSKFKFAEELNYWRQRFRNGEWILKGYYEECLLLLAGESTQDFIAGKTVADFGCGPRGSLSWATRAKNRIGIDVLADLYSE